jgi:hypothetical protein
MKTTAALLCCFLFLLSSHTEAQWTRVWNSNTNEDDHGLAMVQDPAGNTYITGSSVVASGDDVVTLAYDSSGVVKWGQRYHDNNSDPALPKAICYDGNGHVYVLARSIQATGQTILVFKYDAASGAGGLFISTTFNHKTDVPAGIGTDAVGNVYVAFTGSSGSAASNAVLMKIDASSNVKWEHNYNFANVGDTATGLVVDSSGNTFMCGTANDNSGHARALVMKHDSNGSLLWKYFYAVSGGYGTPVAIGIDSLSHVFVTGNQFTTPTSDIFLIKLQPDGTEQIKYVYDGAAHDTDQVAAMAVGADGAVALAGETKGAGLDAMLLYYSADGVTTGLYVNDLGGNRDDMAQSICVDPSGRVYALYRAFPTANATVRKLFVLIFSEPPFNFLSFFPFSSGSGGQEGASILSDDLGHLFVGGSRDGGATGWDMVTAKLVLSPQAANDQYDVNYGHALSVGQAGGVQANDIYPGTSTVIAAPQNGSLALAANGSFTYTPNSGFFGTDSFTYYDHRDGIVSPSATVTLTVVPALASMTAAPAQVKGGVNTTGTITMNHTASSVCQVEVTSSNPALMSAPSPVLIAPGKSSQNFVITTHAVAAATQVTLTAKWNGNIKTVIVTLTP